MGDPVNYVTNTTNAGNPVIGQGDLTSKPPASVFTLTKSVDSRIDPDSAIFTAPTGASSITTNVYPITQPNTQVHTWNVSPPSAGAVVQKAVKWYHVGTCDIFVQAAARVAPGIAFPLPGVDFAIAQPSPLNALVSNWQIQINNATLQWNNQGFHDLVHLMETPKTRASKGVTTRLPLFQNWDDAYNTQWSLGSVGDLQGDGDVPPGSYPIQWVVPQSQNYYFYTRNDPPLGTVPTYSTNPTALTPGTNLSLLLNSVPTGQIGGISTTPDSNPNLGLKFDIAGTDTPYPGQPLSPTWYPATNMPVINTSQYTLAVRFALVDTIQCPPFSWHDDASFDEQGLWGITNMLITAQLIDPGAARWFQGTRKRGLAMLQYAGKWASEQSELWFTYLSPSTTNLEVLPPRCVTSIMYKQVTNFIVRDIAQPFPYTTALLGSDGNTVQIPVPSYTFSQVADVLVISVRPVNNPAGIPDGSSPTTQAFWETDWCANIPNLAFSQFQYANIPGILSNLAANQLVPICRKNGSRASVAQYGGLYGRGQMMNAGAPVSMAGSIIVLRPGIDFALPIGVAAGSMGNIQLQFTLNVTNQSSRPCNFVVSTMAISSGFFVIDNGAARQVLVGLNAKSLYDADLSADAFEVQKLTGGGMASSLAAFASRYNKHGKHLMNFANRMQKLHGSKGGSGPGVAGSGALLAGAGFKRSREIGDDYISYERGNVRGGGGGRGRRNEHEHGSLLEALASDM